MEQTKKKEKVGKNNKESIRYYDSLEAALKVKNDEARAYLKTVKWPSVDAVL